MNTRFRPSLAALLSWAVLGCSMGAVSAKELPDRFFLRRSVEESVFLLQKSADVWYDKKSCFSCHHQGLGSAVIGLARELGYKYDVELASDQIETIIWGDEGMREAMLQGEGHVDAQISIGIELFGLAAGGEPPSKLTNAIVHDLAGKQVEDGHWLSESHRPPLEDSDYSGTAWSLRSIQAYGPPGRKAEMDRRRANALIWLESAAPKTTEERTMHLLSLLWAGAGKDSIQKYADELVSEQREDGGWSQLPFSSPDRLADSDAYATGQALVVLNQAAGMPVTDDVFVRGLHYLLETRFEDGSWRVESRRTTPGNRYFESGFPHGPDQFISYAASAWATMACMLAGDRRQTAEMVLKTRAFNGGNLYEEGFTSTPRFDGDVHARDDQGATLLIEAAVSGSLEDMKQLIERGADVNAATLQGVTALMCSVHDPERVRLLLWRGADFRARSKLGYSASILAAKFSENFETMKMLLALEDDGNTLNETSSLFAASMVGDRQKVGWLLEQGANIDVGHSVGETPLLYAARQGEYEMMRFLLERGADIEATRGETTSLMMSVRYGFTDQVKLLLATGASVNRVDHRGRTALFWGATMDWGHTEIVEALLLAGADPTIAATDGRTPLSQAEQFDHGAILAVLRNAVSVPSEAATSSD